MKSYISFSEFTLANHLADQVVIKVNGIGNNKDISKEDMFDFVQYLECNDVASLDCIASSLTAIVGGVVGWLSGRRNRDNDYLQKQLASVTLLLENNKYIMAQYTEAQEKVIALTDENATLKATIRNLENEMVRLRRKNEENKRKIDEMQRKIDTFFSPDEKA